MIHQHILTFLGNCIHNRSVDKTWRNSITPDVISGHFSGHSSGESFDCSFGSAVVGLTNVAESGAHTRYVDNRGFAQLLFLYDLAETL